ncbi:MAG: sugar ABC transporter substrate-binding protein [Anaeromyxobacter sp.]
MLQKMIRIVAVIAMVSGLGAGTAARAADKQITIGVAVANLQADFFNQIKESTEKYGKEKGINIIAVDAKGDSAVQVSQVQDLLTRKIDALIYIPAGATAANVPVKAAKAAGIPVVNVDRNTDGPPGDTFIASDSVNSTKTLGEWLCKATGGKGKVAIIQGQLGTTPEQDRDNGFNQALKACPGLQVVAKQDSKMWMQDEGFAIAQDMLQKNPDITVFFGRADALALGAAQAVRVSNVGHKVWVIGFDGDVAGLKAVQAGTLDATATQQTQKMGRLAIDSALKLIKKEQVPPIQLQPATLTTKENVGPFIKDHP